MQIIWTPNFQSVGTIKTKKMGSNQDDKPSIYVKYKVPNISPEF